MKQAIIELTRAIERLADAVQGVKEGKEEHSPQTPYKEKSKKQTKTTTARARERFVKPTVEEVAAHVREKGYSIDAERFWNYYESKGWMIGNHTMRSWKSACVTWMKNEKSDPRFRNPESKADEEPSEADRFLMECMARSDAGRKEAVR